MTDEQEGTTEETPQEAKVILIVEDDTDIGAFLQQALVLETPYHPVTVADGFSALKMIHGLKPDLMVLDYQLPQMNGLELYDQLRMMPGFETIPVIFMTASEGMPWRQLEKRQIVGLTKPLELETFLQTIQKLLAEGSVDRNS